MAIEGPLRELGIHDVFQLLDLSRKTGVLKVTSELRDDEGVVYFDAGKVVHAGIRSKPAPLEMALLQAGKITQGDLAAAQSAQSNGAGSARADGGEGGGVIGVLLEHGAISARDLDRWLRLQIEGVVFELMSWREGFFSFEERAAGQMRRDARIKVSTDSLLMEGARRIDEWSRIAHKVPSLSVIPVLAPVTGDQGSSQLDLLPQEWEVLGMIDGQRDLRSIAASLGNSEFEVAKVVYGLVTTGVVAVRSPERSSVSTMAALEGRAAVLERGNAAYRRGAFDEALAAARAVLGADGSDADARVLAARSLARLGRHTEAVDELRRGVQSGGEQSPSLQAELGFAAIYVGDFTAARASWEQFLKLAPSAPQAGRVAAALEAMTRLEQLVGGYENV